MALLAAKDIHKRYGGVRALRGAMLELDAGDVLALIGENGSGKSTLVGVLSGQRWPDAGRILLDGNEVSFAEPSDAIAAGVVVVTQETTLVPELSVAENIFLGHRMRKGRFGIDWAATRAETRALLDELGVAVEVTTVVDRLRPHERQMIEIARAVSTNARVLILDEPTSSLTDDEVEHLFAIVRRLKRSGVGTIFVSHRLDEVEAIADRVTVLRDGVTAGSGPIAEYDRSRMIVEMVGREPKPLEPESGAAPAQVRLRVRGLSVADRVRDVDLDVAPGEIVGLAGLVGAGRTEVFEALFGLQSEVRGEISIDGEPILPTSPREAMRNGIGFVPADRKRFGLVMEMSVRENLMLASGSFRPRMSLVKGSSEVPRVDRAFAQLGIRAPSGSAPVASLSGGNQQKVVLAKWLETAPRVLLLDEPTRGVDIGAKYEIYRLLNELRKRDIAILMSSSEVPELRLLCDRVLVMSAGRVVSAMPADDVTEERIASLASGALR